MLFGESAPRFADRREAGQQLGETPKDSELGGEVSGLPGAAVVTAAAAGREAHYNVTAYDPSDRPRGEQDQPEEQEEAS